MNGLLRTVSLSLVTGLVLVSCGGSDAPTDPVVQLVIEILTGDGQSATVGQSVSSSPTVRVRNTDGQPVSGVAVTFSVAGGGGTVSGANQTTGTDGSASVGSWTLGQTAGSNTLRASASGAQGSPVEFTATGTPDAPAAASAHAGDGQSAPFGTSVAVAPAVRVVDQFGNPVAGVGVTFAVGTGGGSVTGGTQTTGADGVATVGGWQLGTALGANTLVATVAGSVSGSPVTFTATATAGPPATMSKIAGDGQSADVNTAVATAPSVKLVDASGNPAAGIEVTFAVTAGGGSVDGGTQTTGTDGIATVGSWTLGPDAGPNTLEASIAGSGVTGNPATFTATGISRAPASVAAEAGDGQSAEIGTAVATPPSVKVLDPQGDPVAGVTVVFAVASGGGSVTGATATTNSSGVATVGSWTLGGTAGANTLTATVDASGVSGNPVTFTATATDTGPASVEVAGGNGQSALISTAVATAPSVLVKDAQGDPVQGATVTFAVASGGGSVTGGTATTNASGIAAVGSWTLGSTPGANTLTATVSGTGISGNPVTFTATATAPQPANVAVSAGNGQVMIAGQAVPVAPAVVVTDANSNPVAGVTVTFAVASGGGSVTGATATTDANGVATVGSWTLGATVGANSLTATVTGSGITGNPVTFTATGALDPAAMAGTWTGSWTNTTFSSTGAATLTIAVNTTNQTVDLTLDLDGNVFGVSNPAADTKTGSYTTSGFQLNSLWNFYGTGTITMTPQGSVTIVSNNPTSGISRVETTGTVTGTSMTFQSTITFNGGGTAAATTTLTKN